MFQDKLSADRFPFYPPLFSTQVSGKTEPTFSELSLLDRAVVCAGRLVAKERL